MSMLSIATRNPSTSRNPQNGEMLKISLCQMCQMCQAPCPGYICIYLLFHLHRVQRNTSRTERDSTPESVLTDDVHPLVLGSKDQRVCRHFSTLTFQRSSQRLVRQLHIQQLLKLSWWSDAEQLWPHAMTVLQRHSPVTCSWWVEKHRKAIKFPQCLCCDDATHNMLRCMSMHVEQIALHTKKRRTTLNLYI